MFLLVVVLVLNTVFVVYTVLVDLLSVVFLDVANVVVVFLFVLTTVDVSRLVTVLVL